MTSDSWPPNTPCPCSPATNWEVGMVSTNSRSSRRKYPEEVLSRSTWQEPCAVEASAFFPSFLCLVKIGAYHLFLRLFTLFSLSHFIKHKPLISEGCWLKFCLVYPDNILVGGLGKFIAHCNWRSFFKNLFFVVISH